MKVLQKDLPNLYCDEDGIVRVKRGRREDYSLVSRMKKRAKLSSFLRDLLTVLHYFSVYGYPGILNKISDPALTHIIKEEIFEGEVSVYKARMLSFIIKEIGIYKEVFD